MMKYFIAIMVVTTWGTTFVSSKVLLNAGLMPADIFFYRFLMAYFIMLLVCHKKLRADNIKDELTFLGLGLMGGSIYLLTENMALSYSTTANVSILVSTTPIITAFVLALFYKNERMKLRQIIGSFIAFIGVTLIVLNGQLNLHLNPLGDTLALIAATTWAFYSLFMKRVMGRYSSDFITRKIFFYGVLTILPYFAIVQPLDTDTSMLFKLHIIGNLIFLGVIASSLAYLMWSWALREIGTVKASNLIYTQTLVTMILGSIVLGERITLMAVSGVIILFTGVILAVRTPKEKISVKQ